MPAPSPADRFGFAAALAALADLNRRVTILEGGQKPVPSPPPAPSPAPAPKPSPPPSPVPAPSPAPSTGWLTVHIEFAGSGALPAINVSEEQAQGVGTYSDPDGAFVLHCSRATAGELVIDFRSDADGSRDEVVFFLGKLGGSGKNLPPYTATISRGAGAGAAQLARIDVPGHTWWSRWRWQSKPRPVRKTAAQLADAGFTLRYDPTVAMGQTPRTAAASYAPMSWPDMQRDEGATGERDEIGLVTQAQGEWLCTGNPLALQEMMAQAEAHASAPVHAVGADGLGPISIVQYPRAAFFWGKDQGKCDPWLNPVDAAPAYANTQHYGALCYLPFLLTGDPYYLEELQYAANHHVLNQHTDLRQQSKGIVNEMQTRGVAWSIRDIIAAAIATPDSVPEWLRPASYFRDMVGNNVSNWQDKAQHGTPLQIACHFLGNVADDQIGPWQQDMLANVLLWGSMTFREIAPVAAWLAAQAATRGAGLNGFPKSQEIVYYMKSAGASSWADLVKLNGWAETADGHLPPNADLAYIGYLRAALLQASRQGVPGAAEGFAYIDAEAKRRGKLAYKWAVA